MTNFIPWNSQPLEEWATKYARGKFIDLDGLSMHYLEKGSGDPVILIHGFFFDTLTEEIKVLGSMDIPILIVWGREEKSIRLSIGEELAKILKSSRLEILNQAGHCSNIDQYRQFNELVLDFLTTDSNTS